MVNLYKKEVSDEVDLMHADKYQSFMPFGQTFLMGLAKHAHSTSTSLQYLYDISWKQFWMKLIFWMQVNSIFDRCGQAFSKYLQVPINDIIDCRDFWYMHRPTKGNSLLHILINKWLLSFESWTQRFDRGSINDIHLLCLL